MIGSALLKLAGGVAFFLYGMQALSDGLEDLAGEKLSGILKSMTSDLLKGTVAGLLITAVIQSSSAVTVMLVSLVNAGMMTLRQSVGVIMGTNVGTTVTAWLLSTIGIENDSSVFSLLKTENLSMTAAVTGMLVLALSKGSRAKSAGSAVAAFGVLMYGMELMSEAAEPLMALPWFEDLLVTFQNPILCLIAGTLVTAVIQSSSASVGLLQTLSVSGGITYRAAVPIVMGQNIGTCVTALLSGVGRSRTAKKVALIHLMVNVIGTAVLFGAFYMIDAAVGLAFAERSADPVGIAAVHSAFNIISTVMLLPFASGMEKLADALLPEKKGAPLRS